MHFAIEKGHHKLFKKTHKTTAVNNHNLHTTNMLVNNRTNNSCRCTNMHFSNYTSSDKNKVHTMCILGLKKKNSNNAAHKFLSESKITYSTHSVYEISVISCSGVGLWVSVHTHASAVGWWGWFSLLDPTKSDEQNKTFLLIVTAAKQHRLELEI